MVASGQTFGPKQKVIIHLLEIPAMAEKLRGVAMEIEDCSYPLVSGILTTSNEKEAFTYFFFRFIYLFIFEIEIWNHIEMLILLF